MTDRLPLLGAGIALGVLGLFVAAATGSLSWVQWPPKQEQSCQDISVNSMEVGRVWVRNGSYAETMEGAFAVSPDGNAEIRGRNIKAYSPVFIPRGATPPPGVYWQPGITDEERIQFDMNLSRPCIRLDVTLSPFILGDWNTTSEEIVGNETLVYPMVSDRITIREDT